MEADSEEKDRRREQQGRETEATMADLAEIIEDAIVWIERGEARKKKAKAEK